MTKSEFSNKSLKENPTLKCRKCEKLNKLKQNMNANADRESDLALVPRIHSSLKKLRTTYLNMHLRLWDPQVVLCHFQTAQFARSP